MAGTDDQIHLVRDLWGIMMGVSRAEAHYKPTKALLDDFRRDFDKRVDLPAIKDDEKIHLVFEYHKTSCDVVKGHRWRFSHAVPDEVPFTLNYIVFHVRSPHTAHGHLVTVLETVWNNGPGDERCTLKWMREKALDGIKTFVYHRAWFTADPPMGRDFETADEKAWAIMDVMWDEIKWEFKNKLKYTYAPKYSPEQMKIWGSSDTKLSDRLS
jgi:hypothetical protein